jgi:hypothetical protein
MRVGDFFQHRDRLWLRLHEKGGKRHKVPLPSGLESLHERLRAAGIARDNKRGSKGDKLTDKPMKPFDVF